MPKFYYMGVECVSAGILFYKYIDNKLYFMLQKKIDKRNNVYYEDLGGKSISSDKSIFHVAAREAAEETNYVIAYNHSIDYILSLIKAENGIVFGQSKYALFLVEYPINNYLDFSDMEYHHKKPIPRTIEWVPYSLLKNIKLNHRIKNIVNYI